MADEQEIKELADGIYVNCNACLFDDEVKNIAKYVIEEKKYHKVIRGTWKYDAENECFICSECGLSALNNYRGLSVNSNYCPNCGTYMKGEKNDQD